MRIGYMLVFLMLITAAEGQYESKDYNCQGIEIGAYARMEFCLSPGMSAIPGVTADPNFALGRQTSTTFLMGDKKAEVHLLYPCAGIAGALTLQDIQILVEALRPEMKTPGSTAYYTSSSPMYISGQSAVWGDFAYLGKVQTFAAYQPAANAVAVLFFDDGMPPGLVRDLLDCFRMTINPNISPIRPGDCQPALMVPVPAKVYYQPYPVYWSRPWWHNWDNHSPFDNYSPRPRWDSQIDTGEEERQELFGASSEQMMQTQENVQESLGSAAEKMMEDQAAVREKLEGVKGTIHEEIGMDLLFPF